MTEDQRLYQLNQVFFPSAPIEKRNLFYGRTDQIDRVIDITQERGQHGVLFGERGVGKTSLANIIMEILQGNVICSKITCSRNETYKSLWTKALQKIEFSSASRGIGFNAIEKINPQQLSLFLPQADDINSIDVQTILENLQTNLLFVFDEFDSI